MAIKDYWVYQDRQSEQQWALYIVKEYDKRKPDATCLDVTLYCESIENATHSVSIIGLHYDYLAGYVDEFISMIAEYANVDNQDKKQLEREILRILQD